MLRALVAFDGSPDAVEAIDAAAAVLKPAEAVVVHVRGVPRADEQTLADVRRGESMDEALKARDAREAAASQALADRGAQLARAAGWQAESRSAFTYGGVWDEVLRLAGDLSVEVIVLGARGLTGVSAALGSVSDAVVHNAQQPVLVVPTARATQHTTGGHAPALVAYDGSDGSRAALDAAAQLLSARELLICHVGGDRQQADPRADPVVDEAVSRAVAAGCNARGVPAPGLGVAPGLSGRARHGLVAAAQEHEVSVIVIGSRGRPAASELVLGSVAMGVLHHAERPVIVAPPTARRATASR